MKSSIYIKIGISAIIILLWGIGACKKPGEFDDALLDERLSADAATVFDESSSAFGQVIPGLTEAEMRFHDFGDKLFGQSFVTSPSSLAGHGGLGPIFNNISCNRCHVNEGRGTPFNTSSVSQSIFLKTSLPGNDINGGPNPLPGFGLQFQDRAIAGAAPEATISVTWVYTIITLADGTKVELREPVYSINNPYKPLPAGYLLSARMSRPTFGIGILESISESSILRNADANDNNVDGISGRPNYVWDYNKKTVALGRLGWKASTPDIIGQVAKALNEDIGVTSHIFPFKNAIGQPQMSALSETSAIDIPDSFVNALTFYMRTLAVPARRNVNDLNVIAGSKIFRSTGCIKCHADVQTTRTDVSFGPLSNLVVRPYSDLLLHDMGEGLADHRSEFEANGNEWRTPPLWGLGLTNRINGNNFFLHDGRARSFIEAILWHGGEAEGTRVKFTKLSKEDRENLMRFLESL
ncbi:MAG: thiol oxidoreductase [Bacteroidia bacterium]|nr:thiol oxidoreductase [Bacteroidia bacterium]